MGVPLPFRVAGPSRTEIGEIGSLSQKDEGLRYVYHAVKWPWLWVIIGDFYSDYITVINGDEW